MKFICKGAFHIHSTYSDGTGTIPEIAISANKAGLQWVVITDHNNLSGLKNNEEGFYYGVAVMVGEEISPPDSNHYLAVKIDKEVSHNLKPEEIIQEVKNLGGFGFVAHPDERIDRKNTHRPLRWTDWKIRGFDGVELWNYLSDWTDNYNQKLGLYNLIARNKILSGPSEKLLNWWDELNNETSDIVPALGSLDSHAFDFRYFKVFPYSDSMKTITNYLLLEDKLSGDFQMAKKQIYEALKAGKNIIVNRVWNKNNNDLNFSIKTEKERAFTGEKIFLEKNKANLSINLHQKSFIKVFCNGKIIIEKNDKTLECDILKPGKYRFEAYYKNKPWIFSNPICLERIKNAYNN
jgi:hypothetical protein